MSNHDLKITLMHIINNPKRPDHIKELARKALDSVLMGEREDHEKRVFTGGALGSQPLLGSDEESVEEV